MDLRNSALSPLGGFELWGFPGAGKSTQAKMLCHRPELSLVKLRPFVVSFLTRLPVAIEVLSDANVGKGVRHSLMQPRSRSGRVARLAVRQSVTLRGRPYNLIEEGLVHEIWRGLYSAVDVPFDNWRSFMPYIGPNIILLDVAPQEALRRVMTKKKRGPVNRELAGASIDESRWQRAIAAYDLLRQEIERTPGIMLKVIKVDDLSPVEVSEEIIRIVQGSFRRHPRPDSIR